MLESWHAIVNCKTGHAIMADAFAMLPGPVDGTLPSDLNRADRRDDGRELDPMFWFVEGARIETEVQIRNRKSGLWLG